ncbi:rhodanese-like domain-containing protein [Janthinobacterium agaricidamnosum]|uniref:Rhodanese-like domain protein n=1 Tax=Janthinobacterium agaricidamnosum NBRC 102515 = DSM 9628 TaxID=1349767 RepID=W0VEA4_9BURK|nr:rhodanese-like domain-containing protein [Janthinobacterium agaricidamnosum]CDG85667.1 rhodanese-like domain protein [Janthinobacterium agaricidamnosum NBRC 102515 = DSM 9628]
MKFIIDHIFLIGIVVLSGGALLWPALAMRGKRASPLEVTQMINRGKTTVLDVRDAKEFAEGHLRDAKNIPLAELSKRSAELEKSKNKTIIVVCQKGTRSASAVKQLANAGFADAVSLEGGLAAWTTQGLPLAK